MKYWINYTEEGKILGFYLEEQLLNLNVQVSNQVWTENQGISKIKIDKDKNITFEKVDWKTPEEIEQDIFSNKWGIINNYLDNEIPNFINENTGNEFMIKTADLLWIEKESKEWTDEESYSWIQFGIPTFQTDKNELKMAITDAKNKRQNKIAEIFELGA